jgi:hypothetical protein
MATAPNTGTAFTQALMQLLGGSPQFTPPTGRGPARENPPSMPMMLPENAPVPPPRPPMTMSPAAAAAPAILPAAGSAAPPAPAPAAQNPLMALLSGGGGKDLGGMLRAFGAGAANAGNTGGDPYVAFGRGFGGATQHYDINDALQAKQAAASEQLTYEREQDAAKLKRDTDKDAQDMDIRRMSEARQSETSKLNNEKTALEIRRLARQNGLDTKEMLEIERIAQAAGENLWGDERKQVIDETRERLLDQFRAGEGLSGGAGLSPEAAEPMATNDAGETLVLRNGQWVTP